MPKAILFLTAMVFWGLISFSPAMAEEPGLQPFVPPPPVYSQNLQAYAEAGLSFGVSAGVVTQTQGEDSWWISPEGSKKLFEGDTWELRLYARVSFSTVAGKFWTGSNTVSFEQDRIRLGFGPDLYIWTDDRLQAVAFRVLYQGEFAQPMKRSDRARTDSNYDSVLEVQFTFSDCEYGPYKAVELLGNVNAETGVPWYRATAKMEVFTLGSMPSKTLADRLWGRAGNGWDSPWVSFRLGARAEGYQDGGQAHSQAGGYVEAFTSGILPASFDFSLLKGNVGGVQIVWGVWVAIQF